MSYMLPVFNMQRTQHYEYYTASQKKLDHFSLERNLGKYCPILIILSLLQTEINYNQVNHLETSGQWPLRFGIGLCK